MEKYICNSCNKKMVSSSWIGKCTYCGNDVSIWEDVDQEVIDTEQEVFYISFPF